MTHMSEDEKLVRKVAERIMEDGSFSVDTDWTAFADQAVAAIAAVRAWDAEQGLVTVPRVPTAGMVDAVRPAATDWIGHASAPASTVERWQDATASAAVRQYRAMIRAATPAPQSDGEA
tara:strand:- start:3796 stop:4152 length:357 start_codon:yes stop_codon:yes gene_type:complete